MNVPSDVDWKKAYWDVIWNRSYAPAEIYPMLQEIDTLRKLNQFQAAKLMEQDFYLSCIRFVGDTVYIDAQKMHRMKRFIKEADAPGRLESSRYLRCPYD